MHKAHEEKQLIWRFCRPSGDPHGGAGIGGGSDSHPHARVTGWRSLARGKLPQTTTTTTTTTAAAAAAVAAAAAAASAAAAHFCFCLLPQ